MIPEDMYLLSSDGSIVSTPSPKPYPHKPPKCSDCGPLFMKITHMEMIKGIKGHGYYDELVVPIIENSAYESDLTEAPAEAQSNLTIPGIPSLTPLLIEAYPKATAVLVRNHGIYVWGDSWISAKTQAESPECYHYLFDAAIKLNQMGLDWSTPSHGPIKSVSAKAGTFDSEPCRTTGRHLSSTYETSETQDDIKLLREQVQEDLEAGVASAVQIPSEDEGKEKVVAALVANVAAMIKADRKITALKQLQVAFGELDSRIKNWKV